MVKRKIVSIALLSTSFLSLTSCKMRDQLLFLNWGEYIDETLITEFENKYNVDVIMDFSDSNEVFYSKVSSGTTIYDVVCPSDYMVEKLYSNDLLQEIDFDDFKLSNYTPTSTNLRYGVTQIMNQMEDATKEYQTEKNKSSIKNYFVPYLWGTWGIMYDTTNSELIEAVCNSGNEWNALFNRSVLPANTKVAMYDSYQHAYYAAARYLSTSGYEFLTDGIDSTNVVTSELGTSDQNAIRDLIKGMKYDAWGTDKIKRNIVAGNLDVGFMWTGDFLYYYAEVLSELVSGAYESGDVDKEQLETMLLTMTDNTLSAAERTYKGKSGTEYNIGFDFYIPSDTIAFCDNLVIPKDSSNYDLAVKFIDFMSSTKIEAETEDDEELNPSYSNTYYVDYDAVFNSVYDDLVDLSSVTLNDVEDDSIVDAIFDYAIGIAFNNFYPKDEFLGSKLPNFSRAYIKTINKIFNNARS